MRLISFLRRLLSGRRRPSDRFFDARAEALGPKPPDVERELRKP